MSDQEEIKVLEGLGILDKKFQDLYFILKKTFASLDEDIMKKCPDGCVALLWGEEKEIKNENIK
jgi:hypothetical protein